jgi:hypothetical protein
MDFANQAKCKKCGRGMRMVARIAPMGGSKGLIAFLCSDCGAADTILVDPETNPKAQGDNEPPTVSV